MAFGGWGYVGGEGKSARLLRYKFDPCVPQSQIGIHEESIGMQSKQKYRLSENHIVASDTASHVAVLLV